MKRLYSKKISSIKTNVSGYYCSSCKSGCAYSCQTTCGAGCKGTCAVACTGGCKVTCFFNTMMF